MPSDIWFRLAVGETYRRKVGRSGLILGALSRIKNKKNSLTRMWANAKRDGRPAEGGALLEWRAVTLLRREPR